MNECKHRSWVDSTTETITCDWTGEDHTEYIAGYYEETIEDVDTHRYKCTQCSKMFYYSQWAKEKYEGS